jgi:CRISPR/Cas system-associated endonuclease Cas1
VIVAFDAGVSFDGFWTDVTLRLHGRVAWIRRNIEVDLRNEIYELCDTFAGAATRLKSIDQSASVQEVKSFEAALRRIDFGNVADKMTWNMLEL